MRLRNRTHAGELLAKAMLRYKDEPGIVVLALPRGGVPVALAVAKTLEKPLDVFLVRKLGVPGHEELAMGAVSNGGGLVLNQEVIDAARIPEELITQVLQSELKEITRREALYRRDRPALDVAGKTVILIDDGLATGSTMLAAARALRSQKPAKIIAAVPVAPPSTCEQLHDEVDEMVCLLTPEPFFGVGQWYEDFSQTTDREVIEILDRARDWKDSEISTIPNAKNNQYGIGSIKDYPFTK